ncbi:unnamed protein product [Linum trigynum]|uniref:NOG1 N-terminal helical domain-containing protein n=1 Tax=Linum trigynum TaxID=586398 RepID=A0AAV2CGE9_9ROSI
MTGKALPMVVEPNVFKKIAAVPNEKDLLDNFFSEQQRRNLPSSTRNRSLLPSSSASPTSESINNARLLIADISEEHLKFVTEYCRVGAPTPLRTCRSLCVSAVRRMCTVVRRLGPSLAYLEETRRHMAGLPSIDPDAPTMVLIGSPNDGKRSFMRQMARSDKYGGVDRPDDDICPGASPVRLCPVLSGPVGRREAAGRTVLQREVRVRGQALRGRDGQRRQEDGDEPAEVTTVWNMPTGQFQLGARKDNVHGCHIDSDIMLRLLELERGEGEIIRQAEAEEEEGDMRRSVGSLVLRL